MMRLLAGVLLLAAAQPALSDDPVDASTGAGTPRYHPVWPMLLGAAVVTWGAWELGDDADAGRRNITILWGAGAAAGLVLSRRSTKRHKSTQVELNVRASMRAPGIVVRYCFGG